MEAAYAAYRTLFEVTQRPELAVRITLTPGDVLAFDNRRILHGRDAYTRGPRDAHAARLLRRA